MSRGNSREGGGCQKDGGGCLRVRAAVRLADALVGRDREHRGLPRGAHGWNGKGMVVVLVVVVLGGTRR